MGDDNEQMAEQAAEVTAEVEATDAGPLADTDEKRLLYRVLRRRAMLDGELTRILEGAKAMADQVMGKLKAIDVVYGDVLAGMTSAMLVGGKARSIKTPFGVVGFRKQAAKLEIEDEDAVTAAVVEGALPDEVLKTVTTTTIAKSVLNELHKKTGEIPPGCVVQPECDKFYIKHEVGG